MENIKIEFEKITEFLKKKLGKLRAGRVTSALVEDIKVDYFGAPTPIKQLATINTPESNLIIISPWDKNVLPALEKAIAASSPGMNPIVDKDIIRLKMPPLTEERRKELLKIVHQHAEESRIALRNAREKFRDEFKHKVERRELNEDDKFKKFEEIDKLVKEYNEKIDEIKENKEKEMTNL